MRLMHSYFSKPIEFIENKANTLILENPIFFTKIIREILNQYNGDEGNFILSKNFEPIDINKNIEIITDIFNLDFNNKKITNKIYNDLKKLSVSELFEESQNLYNNINIYMGRLIQNLNYPLKYNFNIDILHIFKSCELSLDILSENILEQIINYVLLYREIFNINIFIFINLKSFLSKEEILKLYKTFFYEKIHILLIENDFKYKIEEYEIIRIIDKDLCEIY